MTRQGPITEPTAESVARRFHELYERLAPNFGYETRPESAVPWSEVPERNRSLMVAVADVLLGEMGLVKRLLDAEELARHQAEEIDHLEQVIADV